MDGLAHSYEIKVCPECGQQTDRWCYEHGLDMIAGERIEVVPADLHRGAVEEVERLRETIKHVLAHGEVAGQARSRLREALYLTGGQS